MRSPDARKNTLHPPTCFAVWKRTIGGGEYPDLDVAFATWDRLRGDSIAPRRTDIDPADFVAVLPRILIADVFHTGDEVDFRYRLSGTGICNVHGSDLTAMRPQDLRPPEYGALVHQHYCDAVASRRPALHLFLLDRETTSRSYARLLLPLSEDGTRISMLMAIDSAKQNSRELRLFFDDHPLT